MALAQIENFTQFVTKKRTVQKKYNEVFAGVSEVTPFPEPGYGESACWMTGVYINSEKIKNVSVLCEALKKQGVESRLFWKPMHLQKPYECSPKTSMGVSEKIWKKILVLPSSTQITYCC
jgi:dTDP-4-amino-4,6-dideoxygalactose transaminase